MWSPPPGNVSQRGVTRKGKSFSATHFIERDSVFDVKPETQNRYRPPVAVVAWIGDVLVIDRERDPAPDVGCVIGLENLLEPIVQRPIAQNEAQASQGEIPPVIARDSVHHECHTGLVRPPAPGSAAYVATNLASTVNLRVGEGLVRALVPPQPAKSSQRPRQFLFRVQTEAIFHSALLPVERDVRDGV